MDRMIRNLHWENVNKTPQQHRDGLWVWSDHLKRKIAFSGQITSHPGATLTLFSDHAKSPLHPLISIQFINPREGGTCKIISPSDAALQDGFEVHLSPSDAQNDLEVVITNWLGDYVKVDLMKPGHGYMNRVDPGPDHAFNVVNELRRGQAYSMEMKMEEGFDVFVTPVIVSSVDQTSRLSVDVTDLFVETHWEVTDVLLTRDHFGFVSPLPKTPCCSPDQETLGHCDPSDISVRDTGRQYHYHLSTSVCRVRPAASSCDCSCSPILGGLSREEKEQMITQQYQTISTRLCVL